MPTPEKAAASKTGKGKAAPAGKKTAAQLDDNTKLANVTKGKKKKNEKVSKAKSSKPRSSSSSSTSRESDVEILLVVLIVVFRLLEKNNAIFIIVCLVSESLVGPRQREGGPPLDGRRSTSFDVRDTFCNENSADYREIQCYIYNCFSFC